MHTSYLITLPLAVAHALEDAAPQGQRVEHLIAALVEAWVQSPAGQAAQAKGKEDLYVP